MFQTIQQRIEAVREGQTDTLDLSHFDLTILPDEVFTLGTLRVLRVSNFLYHSHQWLIDCLKRWNRNKDEELMAYFEEEEQALRQDLLIPRHLETLDARIGQLRALEELDLSHNLLDNLPDTLGDLKRLSRLILNDNKLTCVPASLRGLRQLHLVNLRRNPLEVLPSLPQLNQYEYISKHFNQQMEHARRDKDLNMILWCHGKATSYGLVV